MYSIVCKNLRYTVTCLINQDSVSLIDTIIDTGALYSCYKADQIYSALSENQFADCEYKYIGGFVNGHESKYSVKFYKYDVTQFTIGTINLGARSIWITFDERITDNVLGLDILKNPSLFLQLENSNELCLFGNRRELADYVRTTLP